MSRCDPRITWRRFSKARSRPATRPRNRSEFCSQPSSPAGSPRNDLIDRLRATEIVVELAHDQPIIGSVGNSTFDLVPFDRPRNFYMWNSMGMASSIGLGLALARPDLRVIVLDGAGSILMNLVSRATEVPSGARNLVHVELHGHGLVDWPGPGPGQSTRPCPWSSTWTRLRAPEGTSVARETRFIRIEPAPSSTITRRSGRARARPRPIDEAMP